MRAARWMARELVLTATNEPRAAIGEVISVGAQAYHGARDAYAGSQDLTRGGRFGRARVPVSVGGEIFHGISDKRDALELLRAGYGDLRADLAKGAPAGTTAADSVLATLHAFDLFYERELDSAFIRWATEWATYQAWWQRLRSLREAARAAGVAITSPEPPPLPKTVWQRGAEGIGSRIDAALYLGRGAAFFTMTTMGVWGLFTALRSIRDLKILGIEK